MCTTKAQKGILNRYRREGMAFKKIYPQERFGRADLVRLFYHNAIDDFKAAAASGSVRAKYFPDYTISLGTVLWNL